jgi:hypothetical protein
MVRRNRANHPFVSSRTNHWLASGKRFVGTDISNIGETFLNSSRFCFIGRQIAPFSPLLQM